MGILKYTDDLGALTEVRVGPDQPEVLIGRNKECILRTQNKTVSRTHAKVEWRQGRYFLTDLGSANGTFYQRERIKDPVEIDDQQTIYFGTFQVTFELDQQDAIELSDSMSEPPPMPPEEEEAAFEEEAPSVPQPAVAQPKAAIPNEPGATLPRNLRETVGYDAFEVGTKVSPQLSQRFGAEEEIVSFGAEVPPEPQARLPRAAVPSPAQAGDPVSEVVKFGDARVAGARKLLDEERERQAQEMELANRVAHLESEIRERDDLIRKLQLQIDELGNCVARYEADAAGEEVQGRLNELEKMLASSERERTEIEETAESLRAELADATQRLQEAEARLAGVDDAVARTAEGQAAAEARVREAESRIQELQAQLAEAQYERDGYEAQLAEVETRLQEIAEKRGEVEEKYGSLEKEREVYEARMAEAERRTSEALSRVSELEVKLSATKAELEANAQDARRKADEAAKQIQGLETELKTARGERDDLSARLAETRKKAEENEVRKAAAERQVALVQAERDAAKSRAAEAESRVAELTARLESLSGSVLSPDQRSQLESAAVEARRVPGLVAELEASQREIDRLISATADQEETRAELVQARETIERLTLERNALLDENQRWDSLKRQIEEEKSRAQVELAGLRKRVTELTAQVADTRTGSGEDLSAPLKAAMAEIAELKVANRSYLKKLSRLVEENERLKAANPEAAAALAPAEETDGIKSELAAMKTENAGLKAEVDRLSGELKTAQARADRMAEKIAVLEKAPPSAPTPAPTPAAPGAGSPPAARETIDRLNDLVSQTRTSLDVISCLLPELAERLPPADDKDDLVEQVTTATGELSQLARDMKGEILKARRMFR